MKRDESELSVIFRVEPRNKKFSLTKGLLNLGGFFKGKKKNYKGKYTIKVS